MVNRSKPSRSSRRAIRWTDLRSLLVDAVLAVSAAYAALVVCLLAVNVALAVKLRSVIPQSSD